MKEFTNLNNLEGYFTSEAKCLKHFEALRWGSVPSCVHCGGLNPYKLKKGKNYKCRECHTFFNAFTSTLFENTKIPLTKWFKAIYIFTSHKKGISSIQLGKDLGITQKSAWFMLGRLRELLKDKAPLMLSGVVEIDETYMGGHIANKHKKVRERTTKKYSHRVKFPVIGVLQRDGNIYTHTVGIVTKEAINNLVNLRVKTGSTLITDGAKCYNQLSSTYTHEVVSHEKDEFVRGRFHTNSIEGFFSQLKRGVYGIYHHTSQKHLHRYANEFAFRYNTRKQKEAERFDNALRQCEGSRLKYPDLIKKV